MASLRYAVDIDTKGARSSLAALESQITGLGTVIAGGFAVGELVKFSDSIVGLQNKLRTLTADQQLVGSMFKDITSAAGAAGAPLRETGDLYFRIARAAKDLGITQQQTASITDSLAKSISMTGMTAAESSGALLQLGQALQSGRFQGDELRSVLENMPIVSKAMADELGVTVGELKKLGSEGKITSDIFVRAMEKNKKAIDDAFARTVPTAEQALNNLKTAAAIAFDELAREDGTPAAGLAELAQSVLKLTRDLPALTAAIKDLINILTVASMAFLAFKVNAFISGGALNSLLGGIKNVTTGLIGLGGASRQGVAALLGITNETKSIKHSITGLGTAFGIFDKTRGSIMKTTANMGVLGTSIARVGQVAMSLANIFGNVLKIGLRFAGWVGVFLAVVDVINLLYKAVTGSNEKLIDLWGIFKGVITVVRVVYGLIAALGNYIGGKLAPFIQIAANGWNRFMTAIMNTGPMKAAASMLNWVGEKLAWLWNMAKQISGVTAADNKAAMDKIMSVPLSDVIGQWNADRAAVGKPGVGQGNGVFGDGNIKTPPAGGGGGGGKSAAQTAKEQAEALREVKKAIMEVTAAYREQAKTRLEDLDFQLKSLTMSEDQIQVEQNRRDILKEQTDALGQLAEKTAQLEEQKKKKEISNKGYQEAIALIRQEEAAIKQTTQTQLAANEATIKEIQAKNRELERTNHLLDLQTKAAENKAALQSIEDQLKLVGLYGDKLDEVTAQIELQQKLREIDVEAQSQLNDLKKEEIKIGAELYAQRKQQIEDNRQSAIAAANEQAAAQKKVNDAVKKSERTDVRAAIGKRMEEFARSIDPAVLAVQGLESVFDNMSSAIDNFVETGKFKFGDFARSIIADIAKIALKAAATKILGGIFGGLFGLKIPGFAAGGPVKADRPILVGENGPELFVPGSNGSIMTNAALNKNAGQQGQAQPVINNTYITNNINALDSRSVAQVFMENRKSLLGATSVARKELPY